MGVVTPPLIPGLRSQRQTDLYEFEDLHKEFQARQNYTVR